MQSFRITKYDPQKRDAAGIYLADDWTDFSEIGKAFGGTVLTAHQYGEVEAEYVAAALRFFDSSGLAHLRLTGLEDRHLSENLKAHRASVPSLYDTAFEGLEAREDMVVSRHQIAILSQMILRNLLWARLEVDGQFYLHFGWDYYMYVGLSSACQDAVDETDAGELFVEKCNSPYARPMGAVPVCRLFRYDKAGLQIGEEIEFAGASLTALRELLSYSHEHPLYGDFEIDKSIVRALEERFAINVEPAAGYSLDLTGYQGDGG